MSLHVVLVGVCGCEREAHLGTAMRIPDQHCICDPSMGRSFRFAGRFDDDADSPTYGLPIYREFLPAPAITITDTRDRRAS